MRKLKECKEEKKNNFEPTVMMQGAHLHLLSCGVLCWAVLRETPKKNEEQR